MSFQQRYAALILELERINRDLNEYLIGVQQCCHEVRSSRTCSGLCLRSVRQLALFCIWCLYESHYTVSGKKRPP